MLSGEACLAVGKSQKLRLVELPLAVRRAELGLGPIPVRQSLTAHHCGKPPKTKVQESPA